MAFYPSYSGPGGLTVLAVGAVGECVGMEVVGWLRWRLMVDGGLFGSQQWTVYETQDGGLQIGCMMVYRRLDT